MYTLIGRDGNAFGVMGYVSKCMKEMEYSKKEIKTYTDDAESSDYDNLLCVTIDMIDKLNEEKKNED